MQLEFSVDKQIITRTDNNQVVENSRNYLSCQFNFCDDWHGITKTAVFIAANGDIFNVILENDVCVVPWEVIKYSHFSVSVFGGDLITANRVVISVIKSGYAEGKTPSDPTPDVYQQILNSVKPPYIGDNGNWFVWDIESKSFVDSGYKAQGEIPKEDIKNYVDEQTAIIKSDIEGIQEDIKNEAHFRGYVSTNAEIEVIEATPNDFIYSAESGTVWVYDAESGWQETDVPVPDKATPLSNKTPLINGEATAGHSEEASRSDHRHPTDTTRASKAELQDMQFNTQNQFDFAWDEINRKADKTTVEKSTDTAYSFEFSATDNKEVRLGEASSVSFTFGNGEYPDIYLSGLSFDSGATPTAIDYTDSGILNWVDTDCTTVDGLSIFQPSANTHYDILFYFNGKQFVGSVKGYVPSVSR